MAWTTVKCGGCGSEYDVQMYGKTSDREYRAAHWNGLCDACKAKRAADALAVADRDGATLTGSPKQIAWAVQIREKAMTALADAREGILSQSPAGEPRDAATQDYDGITEWLRAQASAAWWIDNRSNGGDVQAWMTRVWIATHPAK